jgi:WD40 repeat protein
MTAAWKTVRVFISSTFRDMQAERDHLVRFVFPRLHEQLLSRRIHLVDMDLRWGVTSEQDASEVCREIINECRPRFLCMLGGRYGTIPEGNELSITADEVHFGVLDAHREKIYALFYFRNGAVTELMDKSSPGSIREPRHSEKAVKLARLKRDIRKNKQQPFLYRPRWNADEERLLDLKAFGDRVERDILATIDDEFGVQPPAQLDEFTEENAAMEAFVEERTERFVLGSREAVLAELLDYASATGGDGYVCLTGAPGSGKSALLAHLSRHSTLNSQPSTLLIRHFVGASPGSTDIRRTLRRLCHELKAGCPDITADIPDDPEKLRVAFPDFLRQACARQRVVILLDAVNQFDPASHFSGLYWLPEELPVKARVIVSVQSSAGSEVRSSAWTAGEEPPEGETPNLGLDELRRRRSPPKEVKLSPLTSADGEAIIEQFRQRYRKKFEPDQIELLLGKDETGKLNKTDSDKPLYLLAALEELRTLGTYEEISRRIAELPPTTQELFAWILKRLENDDGFRDASGRRMGRELVSRFAALLGASRYGLSQRELADLLAPGDTKVEPRIEPDPQGNVAALLHLLRPYLMRRGELLDFYHGQFRAAAEKAYLQTDAHRHAAHKQLADYFRRKADPGGDLSWASNYHRGLIELPYHQTQGHLWDHLYALLTDFGFLEERCNCSMRELSTFGTLVVIPDIEPELHLACEACGFMFKMDGEPLERVRVARTFCPQCGNTVRIVNLLGIGELNAGDCYPVTCSECGRGLLLKREWFADNIRRARLRCVACGRAVVFKPQLRGEKLFVGVYALQGDYQFALIRWPTDVSRAVQRSVLALFLRSIATEQHSWQQMPKLLFQQILASLWWCSDDLRAEVRRLCSLYMARYSARGPWIRRMNKPKEQGSVELRQSRLPVASCLLFCRGGKTLAAGTTTGEILTLDVATGRYDLTPLGTRRVCMIGNALQGDNDEELIVVCDNGNVLAFSLDDQKIVPRMGDIRHLAAVAISRFGNLLAVGTEFGQIKLFEIRTGSLMAEHTGRRSPIAHLAFSGSEKLLLAINVGGQGTVFETCGLAVKGTRAFGCAPDILLPNPPGEGWWISRSASSENIEGPMLTASQTLDLEIQGACAGTTSSGGEVIAIGDLSGRVVIGAPRHEPTFTQEFRMAEEIRATAISSDLLLLAAADSAGNYEVHRLDTPRSNEIQTTVQAVTRPCYSRDGSTLVLGTTRRMGVLLMEPFEEVGVTLPGTFTFRGPADLALTGGRWAVAGERRAWKGWDIVSRTELGSMGAAGDTLAVAVSPDGHIVATGHSNGTAILWDFTSGAERGRSKLHNDAILALTFLPQGLELVSIGADAQVRGWLLESKNPSKGDRFSLTLGYEEMERGFLKVVRMKPEWSQVVGSLSGGLATDRGGARLAVAADQAVRILAPKDGRELFHLAEIPAEWTALEFSPDDLLLLAISTDGLCCVWDIERRRILAHFELSGCVAGCSWRPDGGEFAVVRSNGDLVVLRIEAREPSPPVVPTVRQSDEFLRLACPHTLCGSGWDVRPVDIGSIQTCPRCRRKVKIGNVVNELDRFSKDTTSEPKECE